MKFYFGQIDHKSGFSLGNIFIEDQLEDFIKEVKKNNNEYSITEISEPLFNYIVSLHEELNQFKKNDNMVENICNSISDDSLEYYNKKNNTNLTKEDLIEQFKNDKMLDYKFAKGEN